jgi:hypothetical protein
VNEDKSVQAYLKGRKHLVIFDDVDVFLPVERELGRLVDLIEGGYGLEEPRHDAPASAAGPG